MWPTQSASVMFTTALSQLCFSGAANSPPELERVEITITIEPPIGFIALGSSSCGVLLVAWVTENEWTDGSHKC